MHRRRITLSSGLVYCLYGGIKSPGMTPVAVALAVQFCTEKFRVSLPTLPRFLLLVADGNQLDWE